MKRADKTLRVLVTGLLCLGLLGQPVSLSAFVLDFDLQVNVKADKDPDPTVPIQYIDLPDTGGGLLWKPQVPDGGVPSGQTSLTGDYWLPLGTTVSLGGKTAAQIKQELAKLKDFAGSTIVLEITWQEFSLLPSGHYDFSLYDIILEELQKNKISALVLIKMDELPSWLSSNYLSYHPPGLEIDPQTGKLINEHTVPWPSKRASYSHPQAVQEAEKFITQLVERYASGGGMEKFSPVIISWILDMGEGYIDGPYNTYIGYEDESVKAYRQWLQNKYTSIVNLNVKWGTIYSGFDKVNMPSPFYKPTPWATEYKYITRDDAGWYDLVQWRETVLAGWAKNLINKIITAETKWLKSGVSPHLVSIHAPGEEPGDADWRYSSIDPAEIVSACKSGGKSLLSFWALSGKVDTKGNISTQWQLARAQALTGLPVLMLKLGIDSGLAKTVKRRLLTANIWQLIYGGAIGVQLAADQLAQDSAQWQAVKDVADVLDKREINVRGKDNKISKKSFTGYLAASSRLNNNVGFLIGEGQDTIFNRAEAEMAWLYNGLKRIGLLPGFIKADDFVNKTYNSNKQYQAVLLARNQKMTDALFNALSQEDIRLHANADLPGLLDEYGDPRHTPQGGGPAWDTWRLTIYNLFGIDADSSRVDPDLEDSTQFHGYESPAGTLKRLTAGLTSTTLNFDGQIDMWKNRDQLAPGVANILGKFANGNPALAIKDRKAALTAFGMGDSSGSKWDWAARCSWLDLIYKSNSYGFGLSPAVKVKNGGADICSELRQGENGSTLVYIYNYSDTTVHSLELQSDLFKGMRLGLLVKGTELADKSTDGVVKNLVIGPREQLFIFSTLPQEQKQDDDQKNDDDKQNKGEDESTDENRDEDYYLKQLPIDENFIYHGDGPIIHDGSTTNVLPALTQATDGSGNVLITYSILDGQQDSCSVSSIQYQVTNDNNQSVNTSWQDLQAESVTGSRQEIGSRVDTRGSAHTLAWTNYKECITDTVLSDVRIRLKVSDGALESQYASSPAFNIAAKWYLAEGSPHGFDEWILITNPNNDMVYARATFVRPDGTTIERDDLTIWGNSRYTLHINDFISDQPVSAIIESIEGEGIVVERAMYWDVDGIPWAGGHVNLGVTVPSTKWYFAEGRVQNGRAGDTNDYLENFDMWLLILNPQNQAAELSVKLIDESGTMQEKQLSVAALSRYSLDVSSLVTSGALAVEVTADNQVPVVVERSMYWNSGNERWIGGHCGSGVTVPSRTWYFAEGCTAERGAYIGEKSFELNFTEWLLLYNPGTQTTAVTMTFYKEDGSILRREVTLAGNQRETVKVNDIIHNDLSSVKLESAESFVAERSMYWDVNGINWAAGHNSAGISAPGKVWYLAEGVTAEGFEQWILLFNPQEQDAAVTLEFIDSYGLTTEEQVTVPAKSRRSVYVADIMPEDVVSARIEADQNIVVERAMYWDSGEYRWVGGHSSKAFR